MSIIRPQVNIEVSSPREVRMDMGWIRGCLVGTWEIVSETWIKNRSLKVYK